MEKIIIALLVLNFGTMLGLAWYFKTALEDIHGHVFDEELEDRRNLFQSFLEGWNEEAEEEEKKKKKRNAK